MNSKNVDSHAAAAGQVDCHVGQRADGGAAFPVLPPQDTAAGIATGYPYPEACMTLRDYFAAKATDGDVESLRDGVPRVTLVVDDAGFGSKRVMHNALPANWRQIARYMHADAMLAVRAA